MRDLDAINRQRQAGQSLLERLHTPTPDELRSLVAAQLAHVGTNLSTPEMQVIARNDVPEALRGRERQQMPPYGAAPMGMAQQEPSHISKGTFPNALSLQSAVEVEQMRGRLAGVGAQVSSNTQPLTNAPPQPEQQGPWAAKISTTPSPGGRGEPRGRS